MAPIAANRPPSRIRPRRAEFEIVLRARYPGWAVLVTALWSAVWVLAIAGLVALYFAPEGTRLRAVRPPGLAVAGLAVLAAAAGLFLLAHLAWMLYGQERITVRSGALRRRRELFGLGRWHEVPLERVTHVAAGRFDDEEVHPGFARPFLGKGMGYVLIREEGADRLVCRGIAYEQALQVAEEIRAHLELPDEA